MLRIIGKHTGLIHHSDRGSQYASHAYRGLLAEHGIACSMSGKGDCLDNAVAERFLWQPEARAHVEALLCDASEARDDVIEYIEISTTVGASIRIWGMSARMNTKKIARVA
jgi:hypothetical protein